MTTPTPGFNAEQIAPTLDIIERPQTSPDYYPSGTEAFKNVRGVSRPGLFFLVVQNPKAMKLAKELICDKEGTYTTNLKSIGSCVAIIVESTYPHCEALVVGSMVFKKPILSFNYLTDCLKRSTSIDPAVFPRFLADRFTPWASILKRNRGCSFSNEHVRLYVENPNSKWAVEKVLKYSGATISSSKLDKEEESKVTMVITDYANCMTKTEDYPHVIHRHRKGFRALVVFSKYTLFQVLTMAPGNPSASRMLGDSINTTYYRELKQVHRAEEETLMNERYKALKKLNKSFDTSMVTSLLMAPEESILLQLGKSKPNMRKRIETHESGDIKVVLASPCFDESKDRKIVQPQQLTESNNHAKGEVYYEPASTLPQSQAIGSAKGMPFTAPQASQGNINNDPTMASPQPDQHGTSKETAFHDAVLSTLRTRPSHSLPSTSKWDRPLQVSPHTTPVGKEGAPLVPANTVIPNQLAKPMPIIFPSLQGDNRGMSYDWPSFRQESFGCWDTTPLHLQYNSGLLHNFDSVRPPAPTVARSFSCSPIGVQSRANVELCQVRESFRIAHGQFLQQTEQKGCQHSEAVTTECCTHVCPSGFRSDCKSLPHLSQRTYTADQEHLWPTNWRLKKQIVEITRRESRSWPHKPVWSDQQRDQFSTQRATMTSPERSSRPEDQQNLNQEHCHNWPDRTSKKKIAVSSSSRQPRPSVFSRLGPKRSLSSSFQFSEDDSHRHN